MLFTGKVFNCFAAKCRNLRHFNLSNDTCSQHSDQQDHNTVGKLIDSAMFTNNPQLEKFVIQYKCTIDNALLFSIAYHCKYLRNVVILGKATAVDNCISGVIEILQQCSQLIECWIGFHSMCKNTQFAVKYQNNDEINDHGHWTDAHDQELEVIYRHCDDYPNHLSYPFDPLDFFRAETKILHKLVLQWGAYAQNANLTDYQLLEIAKSQPELRHMVFYMCYSDYTVAGVKHFVDHCHHLETMEFTIDGEHLQPQYKELCAYIKGLGRKIQVTGCIVPQRKR